MWDRYGTGVQLLTFEAAKKKASKVIPNRAPLQKCIMPTTRAAAAPAGSQRRNDSRIPDKHNNEH